MKRLVSAMTLTAMVVATAPASAYLKFGVRVGTQEKSLTWADLPVRYYVTERSAPGVESAALQGALERAFATWQSVPTATIRYEFAGFTSAVPGEDDGRSTLGFLDRPDLDRVLASTSLLIDDATGELLESDIFFNASFDWSVASGGEAGRFDLESVALHEIGHLSGLGHSAIGETELVPGGGRRVIASGAVMFPIAFAAGSIAGRTLRPDDIAGLSDLYPTAESLGSGSLSGRVVESDRGVFGAHVVAFSLASGALVGGFALDADGRFSIGGLTPGTYVVRAEPLDDVSVDSFFSSAGVNVDFRVGYAPRLGVVPRGGDSDMMTIEVVPK